MSKQTDRILEMFAELKEAGYKHFRTVDGWGYESPNGKCEWYAESATDALKEAYSHLEAFRRA